MTGTERACYKLVDYFGGVEAAAHALGITRQWFRICRDNGTFSPQVALVAQKASKGAIKAQDLCPRLKEIV